MRLNLAILVAATAAFLASSLAYVRAPGRVEGAQALMQSAAGGIDNSQMLAMARPDNIGLQAVLAAVWAAVIMHLVRAVRRARLAGALGGPGTGFAAADLPFSLALAAGAVWPWTLRLPGILPCLLAVTMMAAASLWASLERHRHRFREDTIGGTVEIFAGWATVALYSCFTAVLVTQLGVSASLAAVVSLLMLMVTAVEVQLRLGSTATYGATVIMAMIAVAAGAVATNMTVATAAIIAVAALVAVLVRVLS